MPARATPATLACLPRRFRATPGLGVSPGASSKAAARTATAIAAPSALGQIPA